jgi:hypothetical protein
MPKCLMTVAAGCLAAAAASAKAPAPTELPVFGVPWHLSLALGAMKPFVLEPGRPGRQTYDFHTDDGTSVMTIAVENVEEPATLDGCRDVFDRRPGRIGGELKGLHAEQRGDSAMQEYDWYGTVEGRAYVQHNVFSCRVRGTYYIDVHASKLTPGPGDAAALRALVDGVRIVE